MQLPLTPPRMEGTTNGPLTLMLAMDLIVLALFVMLNSVAQQATHQVKGDHGSLRQDGGYDHREVGQGNGSDDVEMLDGPARQREVHEELRGMVANRLRLVTPEMSTDARGVRLLVARKIVFTREGDLTRSGQAWLEDFAAVLQTNGKDWKGRLMVLGGQAEGPVLAKAASLLAPLAMVDPARIRVGYRTVEGAAPPQVVEVVMKAPAWGVADRKAEQVQQVLTRPGGTLEGVGRVD